MSSSTAEKEVKCLVHYFILPEHKETVARELIDHFFPNRHDELCSKHYLSAKQMKEMAATGMEIGGHSVSRTVLSCLSAEEQIKEVGGNMDQLKRMLGTEAVAPTFCYPYGGEGSYNTDTELALSKAGVKCCFAMKSAAITTSDIAQAKLKLPRYDCNEFAFGDAWLPQKLSKAVVFASNQPQHLHLVHQMAELVQDLVVVMEVSKVTAPVAGDPALRDYLSLVKESETSVFGGLSFMPRSIRVLCSAWSGRGRICVQ